MTITEPKYFEEIIGRLRKNGHTVNHFVLGASKETLLKRLKSRGETKNSWGAKRIEKCIEAHSSEVFKHHLDTENKSIEQVAEEIAKMAFIELLPNNDSAFIRKQRKIKTQIKHMHFFK